MEMDKAFFRSQIKERRNRLTALEIQTFSHAIVTKYGRLDCYRQADVLFAYISKKGEVDVSSLLYRADWEGKKIVVPHVISSVKEGAKMEFVFWKPDSVMEENRYHILEPIEGEVFEAASSKQHLEILLPGLCFDLYGGRIGYGGGYYDRYVAKLASAGIFPHKTALAFDFQVFDRLPEGEQFPTEGQDIPYDLLLTEHRMIMGSSH